MNVLSDLFTRSGRQLGDFNFSFFILCALAIFSFALGWLVFFSGLNNPIRKRLAAIVGEPEQKTSGLSNMSRFMRFLSRFLMPRRVVARERAHNQLIYAGYNSTNMLRIFFGAKLFIMLLCFFSAAFFLPMFIVLTTLQLLSVSLLAGYCGSVLINVWLDWRVSVRQKKLRFALPDALDLLVICVESGLGIAPAIQRVAEEIHLSHPEFAAELAIVNAEIRAGIDRSVALISLGTRTGLSEIRGLTGLLAQTMQFGGSVGATLRTYSADFRDRRLQAAEEQAAKVSTKMIFPLVFCIFPSFFLVAIGPAVIALMGAFSK